MNETTTIIVAIVAALSLALQGTLKALDLLKKRKAATATELPSSFADEWRELHDWTKDLYTWHNLRDADGVPVWYVSSRHAQSLETIAQAITTQTEILRNQQTALDAIRDKVGK